MTAIEHVGMVGVGTMGLPMAANLIERGYTVHGYRRSDMDDFIALGGEPVGACAELAQRCEVVCVILPDEDALDDVALGEKGLIAGAHDGMVVIELSTMRVDRKQRVRDALAPVGVQMLDAPISGMPGMVTARSASILASGPSAVIDRCRDVMLAITDHLEHLGAFGNGTTMKLVANMLVGVHTLAAAEALALARRGGLDPDTVLGVLSGGIASSTILQARGPMMVSGSFTPAPGPVDTLLESVHQIREFADQVGSPTPLFTQAAAAYQRAHDDGRGHEDIAMVYSQLVDDVPVSVG